MTEFHIAGSGIYLPKTSVSSLDLENRHGFKPGTIYAKTGVESRYYASAEESASYMAKKAIESALNECQLSISDIDCLIAASGTMEQAIPCNAAKILAQFQQSTHCTAFDINMTCLSALAALETAQAFLQSQRYRHIVIVSSEVASVGLDWSNAEVGGLFGDGAAALVLSGDKLSGEQLLGEKLSGDTHTSLATSPSMIEASLFQTYSAGVALCEIKGGGSLYHPSKVDGDYQPYGLFRMQGKELYRQTAKIIEEFSETLFAKANVTRNEIDWLVPHQASGLGLSHIMKKLGVAPERFINLLQHRGNQIAASLPSALHELLKTGKAKSGERVFLLGTSAGLSVGGILLRL